MPPFADTSSRPIQIVKDRFGSLPDGKVVYRFTITNRSGLELAVINYGGIIVSLKTPDASGILQDIVLGFDDLEDYRKDSPYFGALIGRYGNRIAKGEFQIDGQKYSLAKNNLGNHLHGGIQGFDKVYWDIEEIQIKNDKALKLTYRSKDLEEGYPGNLDIEVIYHLTQDNQFQIKYFATTDKKTVINLTQHTYFNLTGNPINSILNHELTIHSNEFLPIDETLIPTGEFRKVSGTPFDFNQKRSIGSLIHQKDEQLKYGLGYDHCWILDRVIEGRFFAASVVDPSSGRAVDVYTSEPGMQFYSGNFLDGTLIGKKGVVYHKRTGFCLETEHYPDSPNNPNFPSVQLNPGERYESFTTYRFYTKK